MSIFEILLIIIVTYACSYVIVNRICSCVEQCNIGEAYKEYIKLSKDGESNEEEPGTDEV